MDLDVNYYSRGGQCPYQAEGCINNKYYFYFRERHGFCALELFKSKDGLDGLNRRKCDIGYEISGIENDKQAHKIITNLFLKLVDIFDEN